MGLGEIKKKTQASKSIQTQSQTQEFKKDISYANHRRMSVQNHSVQLSPDLFDSVSDTENIEKEKQNISFSVTETKLHMDQAASDVIDGEAFLPEEMEIEIEMEVEEIGSIENIRMEEEILSDHSDPPIEEKKEENAEDQKEENVEDQKEENVEDQKEENVEDQKEENVEDQKEENVEDQKEENAEVKKEENAEEKKEDKDKKQDNEFEDYQEILERMAYSGHRVANVIMEDIDEEYKYDGEEISLMHEIKLEEEWKKENKNLLAGSTEETVSPRTIRKIPKKEREKHTKIQKKKMEGINIKELKDMINNMSNKPFYTDSKYFKSLKEKSEKLVKALETTEKDEQTQKMQIQALYDFEWEAENYVKYSLKDGDPFSIYIFNKEKFQKNLDLELYNEFKFKKEKKLEKQKEEENIGQRQPISEELQQALEISKQRKEQKAEEAERKKQQKREERERQWKQWEQNVNLEGFKQILNRFNDPADQSSENFQVVKRNLELIVKNLEEHQTKDTSIMEAFLGCYKEAVGYYNEHRGHRWSSKGKRRKEAVNDLVSFMQRQLLNDSFPQNIRFLILQQMVTDTSSSGFQSKKSQDFFEGEGKVLLKEETKECQTLRFKDHIRLADDFNIDGSTLSDEMKKLCKNASIEKDILGGKFEILLPILYKLDLSEDKNISSITDLKNSLYHLFEVLKVQPTFQKQVEGSMIDPSLKQMEFDEAGIESQFINCYTKAFDCFLEFKESSGKKATRRKDTVSNFKSVMEGLIDELPLQEETKEKIRQSVKEIQNNREKKLIGERMAEALRNAYL